MVLLVARWSGVGLKRVCDSYGVALADVGMGIDAMDLLVVRMGMKLCLGNV